MDYEKRYKEALNKAKELMKTSVAFDRFTIEHIFPELKESKDEKIRKVLVDYFKRYKEEECGIKTFYGIPADDILAWLEKQGIQPRYNIGDILCDKLCTTLNKEAQPNMEIVDIKNGMYICDKGSFPVSQQDEYELVSKKIDTNLNDDSVSNELREASTAHAEKEMKNQTFLDNLEFELIYTFEEGAKWQAAQKHTLNKEDEEMLNLIIARLQSHPDVDFEEYSKEYDWLNSPKARSTWKPSDAQMMVLNDVITNGRLSNANERILKGLQEQLKKLK